MACENITNLAINLKDAATQTYADGKSAASGASDSLLASILANVIDDLMTTIGGVLTNELNEQLLSGRLADQVGAVISSITILLSGDALYILVLAQIAAEAAIEAIHTRDKLLDELLDDIATINQFLYELRRLGQFPKSKDLYDIKFADSEIVAAIFKLRTVIWKLSTFDVYDQSTFDAAKTNVGNAVSYLIGDSGEAFEERYEINKALYESGELTTDPIIQTALDLIPELRNDQILWSIWQGMWEAILSISKKLPADYTTLARSFSVISQSTVDLSTGEEQPVYDLFTDKTLDELNVEINLELLSIQQMKSRWEALRDEINRDLIDSIEYMKDNLEAVHNDITQTISPEQLQHVANLDLATSKVKWAEELNAVYGLMQYFSYNTTGVDAITNELAELDAFNAYLSNELQFPDVPLLADDLKNALIKAIFNLPGAFITTTGAVRSIIEFNEIIRSIGRVKQQDAELISHLAQVNFTDDPTVKELYDSYVVLYNNLDQAGLEDASKALSQGNIEFLSSPETTATVEAVLDIGEALGCLSDQLTGPSEPVDSDAALQIAAEIEDKQTVDFITTTTDNQGRYLSYYSDPTNLVKLTAPLEGFSTVEIA